MIIRVQKNSTHEASFISSLIVCYLPQSYQQSKHSESTVKIIFSSFSYIFYGNLKSQQNIKRISSFSLFF